MSIFSSLKKLQAEGKEESLNQNSRIGALQKQLSETTKKLEEINSLYEELKSRGDLKLDEMRLEHEQRDHETRQRNAQEQEMIKHKQEAKLREAEENFEKQLRRQEAKIAELERARDENLQKRVRDIITRLNLSLIFVSPNFLRKMEFHGYRKAKKNAHWSP